MTARRQAPARGYPDRRGARLPDPPAPGEDGEPAPWPYWRARRSAGADLMGWGVSILLVATIVYLMLRVVTG